MPKTSGKRKILGGVAQKSAMLTSLKLPLHMGTGSVALPVPQGQSRFSSWKVLYKKNWKSCGKCEKWPILVSIFSFFPKCYWTTIPRGCWFSEITYARWRSSSVAELCGTTWRSDMYTMHMSGLVWARTCFLGIPWSYLDWTVHASAVQDSNILT